MSLRPPFIPATPFAALMDHAQPALPQTLSTTEAFAFGDVPKLTAALKGADEAAFAWLHAQWSQRINRYCFALAAGDDVFASEISQATWLRIVRHIRVVKDESALWNWIACAARHAATDLRRTGGRYRQALARFGEWWSQPACSAPADPSDALLTALEAALLQLSEEDRHLIDGRYFTGDSLASIGARQALSERAVEGRLARLRQRLRELIAQKLRSQTP